MRHARLFIAMGMAAAMLLAGCGGKNAAPTPQPTPPPTEQTSNTPSPLEQEQKKPLTPMPSKPAQLAWPKASTASDTEIATAIAKAQDLLNSHKADEAVKVLEPLAGVHNRDLQIALGLAEYNNKNLDGAAAAYLRAQDADPKSAVAHNNLGNVYRDQTKYDLAVAEYQKAISLDSHLEFAYTNMQSILNSLGHPVQAKQVLLQGISANPNSANLWAQLGDLQASQKDYQGARDAYAHALKIDPNHNQAKTGLNNLPKQ